MENRSALKVLAVVVLLVVSNYISWNVGKSGSLSIPGAAGSAALPARVQPPDGIRAFGGTVETISDSGFALKLSPYDPFASKGPSVRNVSVDERTVIERLIQKDNATIQKEQAAFMEKLSASGGTNPDAPLTPPEPFIRERIALTDLHAGDTVLVSANEDISSAKKFVAVRVSLQPRVSAPTTPKAPTN